MNEIEKAKAAIQEAMLQDPVIHNGMPFYLVIGPALETAMKSISEQTTAKKPFRVVVCLCKDCDHYHEDVAKAGGDPCDCVNGLTYPNEIDFCCYGKLRENKR